MAERTDREHFIPIRKRDLIELLCHEGDVNGENRELLREMCRLLDATLHFEYHERFEELTHAYSFFDPDTDTQRLGPVTRDERERHVATLFDSFVVLLERANFVRLSRDDIVEALKDASDWGLNLSVDFDVFDRLEVFARGDVVGQRTRRRWQNLFRPEEISVPIYQRLVLILRLRESKQLCEFVDTESVYIKLFKDIPKLDLEMLLPGTRVQLSVFDRGKILLPTLSGVAMTVWKLLQGALTIALSGLYGTLAFLGLVGGTVGYGLRSFYGYMQTKQKYQLNLTQSLYYQNLDNNAGALFRLLNEAEEQEFREAALAYFLLLCRAGRDGWSRERLDDEIEGFLQQRANIHIDFEIGDAVSKLIRFKLVYQLKDGVLRAVPLRDALEALDRAWDNAFTYHRPPAA